MYRNLMLTMVLGGLWHGAGWNFIIWGFFHGAALIAGRFISLPGKNILPSALHKGLAIIATFIFVSFLWIFFRAQTFAQSLSFIKGLVVSQTGLSIYPGPVLSVTLLTAIGFHIYNAVDHPAKYLGRISPPVHAAAIGAAVSLFIALTAPTHQPFIYFQF